MYLKRSLCGERRSQGLVFAIKDHTDHAVPLGKVDWRRWVAQLYSDDARVHLGRWAEVIPIYLCPRQREKQNIPSINDWRPKAPEALWHYWRNGACRLRRVSDPYASPTATLFMALKRLTLAPLTFATVWASPVAVLQCKDPHNSKHATTGLESRDFLTRICHVGRLYRHDHLQSSND